MTTEEIFETIKKKIDDRMTDNIVADTLCTPGGYFAGAAKEDLEIMSIIDEIQEQEKVKPKPVVRLRACDKHQMGDFD